MNWSFWRTFKSQNAPDQSISTHQLVVATRSALRWRVIGISEEQECLYQRPRACRQPKNSSVVCATPNFVSQTFFSRCSKQPNRQAGKYRRRSQSPDVSRRCRYFKPRPATTAPDQLEISGPNRIINDTGHQCRRRHYRVRVSPDRRGGSRFQGRPRLPGRRGKEIARK